MQSIVFLGKICHILQLASKTFNTLNFCGLVYNLLCNLIHWFFLREFKMILYLPWSIWIDHGLFIPCIISVPIVLRKPFCVICVLYYGTLLMESSILCVIPNPWKSMFYLILFSIGYIPCLECFLYAALDRWADLLEHFPFEIYYLESFLHPSQVFSLQKDR